MIAGASKRWCLCKRHLTLLVTPELTWWHRAVGDTPSSPGHVTTTYSNTCGTAGHPARFQGVYHQPGASVAGHRRALYAWHSHPLRAPQRCTWYLNARCNLLQSTHSLLHDPVIPPVTCACMLWGWCVVVHSLLHGVAGVPKEEGGTLAALPVPALTATSETNPSRRLPVYQGGTAAHHQQHHRLSHCTTRCWEAAPHNLPAQRCCCSDWLVLCCCGLAAVAERGECHTGRAQHCHTSKGKALCPPLKACLYCGLSAPTSSRAGLPRQHPMPLRQHATHGQQFTSIQLCVNCRRSLESPIKCCNCN
jgi:hypothetical protein